MCSSRLGSERMALFQRWRRCGGSIVVLRRCFARTHEPESSSSFVRTLERRGVLYSTFPDTLLKNLHLLDSCPRCVYAGFDPTADSLHVGHLLVLTNLLRFYAAGFDVIALIGGATALLGDPSGRTHDRPELAVDAVERNARALAAQIDQLFANYTKYVLKNEGKDHLKPVRIINNAHWYQTANVIDFMRDVGRKFRMHHLLQKSAVRERLESAGMAYSEFSYQIFQAYDWLQLHERFGCQLQLGGTDQLWNVHSGRDLIQRVHQKEAYGLFVPLVTTDGGAKLGKSEGNAIWLSAARTSPYELYQHCMKKTDFEVQKFLQFYTMLPLESIEQIYAKHMRRPKEWHAQRKLAEHVTLLVHGEDGRASAERCSAALFSDASIDQLAALSAEETRMLFNNVPTVELEFSPGMTLLELALKAKCFADTNEAQTEIAKGALRVNRIKIREPDCVLVPGTHILSTGFTVLGIGHRRFVLVKWQTM